MSKIVLIKLTKASPRVGPFILLNQVGETIAENLSRGALIRGINLNLEDNITSILIKSIGDCEYSKRVHIGTATPSQLKNIKFKEINTACLWRHLTNANVYNNFYGRIHPYVIEYVFSYQYQDQILQNIQDYTKTYKYSLDDTGVFSYNNRVEVDAFFNKSVIYNGQQSSGNLVLVPKPKNNMQAYLKYPIYETNSKQIMVTKSDNFYQYNTFWSIVKDSSQPLFITPCDSLSVPKQVNDANMDYGMRSFKKEPFKAKELRIRHTLDNRDDIHLVSQFIVIPTQISYK